MQGPLLAGKRCIVRPLQAGLGLDFRLLGYLKRIVYFNTEVAVGALDLVCARRSCTTRRFLVVW